MRSVRMRLQGTAILVMLAAGAHGVCAQAPGDGQPASQPAKPSSGLAAAIERWLDVQAATVQARYRRVESSANVVIANHMQDSLLLRTRIKFDAKGRYGLNSTLQTGPTFTGSWNNVGWGTGGPRQTGVFLKHLFLLATPVRGVDLMYGSFGFVRGESSEITTFDNDGYMLGGRATLHRPDKLYLDEVSGAFGYFGSPAEPGFSDRYTRFDTVNYYDAVGTKKVGHGLALSASYTYQASATTLRAAFNLRTPWAHLVDGFRYEHYCRVDRLPACGFAGTLEKTITAHVNVSGGYADIDPDFGGVNGDRYTRGRRMFGQASVLVLRDLTVSAFGTQAFDNPFPVASAHRFDLIVSYNALGPLQRAGLFR